MAEKHLLECSFVAETLALRSRLSDLERVLRALLEVLPNLTSTAMPPIFSGKSEFMQALADVRDKMREARALLSVTEEGKQSPYDEYGICRECGGQYSDLDGHRAHAHPLTAEGK